MISAQLAQKLLQIKAIKLSPQNPFTWASGMRSPIYCDNRITLSYPDIRRFVKKSLAELSTGFKGFDAIAGVATAGIAHGALLADELNLPFIYVRSKPKAHGRENLIEGDITNIGNALVVEDLISTGGSSIQAVNALRDAGIVVSGVVALFTYQFDQSDVNFRDANCKYATLSNYNVMLDEAKASNYISEREYEILSQWSADPKGWYDQHFS